MLIDGEKYACEACVRGHRVSNCQHSDRPLQHINKKGRPVSQCQHCRTMRKSRTAHVKCDCGERSHKCAHLQPTLEGHKETCCCNHGGRCTCAHKKEPALDTVPESDSEGEGLALANTTRPKPPTRRRRANTVHSDGILSFDQNGHHKPVGKHGRSSSKSTPYTLSRVNSASSAVGSTDNILHKLSGESTSRSTTDQRRVKSEHASPPLTASRYRMNGALPPLDLSAIEYPSYSANASSFDLFGSGFCADQDGPMFSAGLSSAPVDWSHYDLGEAQPENFAPSSYSQAGAQSFNGMFDFSSGSEQMPHLANTTSTSGDVSEVEDFMPSAAESDFEGFGATSGFLRQGNLMTSSADISRIDYDSFYKASDNAAVASSMMSSVEDDPAFWMPNYNEGMATIDESVDPIGQPDMTNAW